MDGKMGGGGRGSMEWRGMRPVTPPLQTERDGVLPRRQSPDRGRRKVIQGVMYAPTKRPSWKEEEEEETDEFRLRFSRGGMKREAAAAVGINQGFFIEGGGEEPYIRPLGGGRMGRKKRRRASPG